MAKMGYRVECYPGKLHTSDNVLAKMPESVIPKSLRPYSKCRQVELKLKEVVSTRQRQPPSSRGFKALAAAVPEAPPSSKRRSR